MLTMCVCAPPGRMILSGAADGLVAISSPTTGITVRVVSDHKGAPISCLDVTFLQVGVKCGELSRSGLRFLKKVLRRLYRCRRA